MAMIPKDVKTESIWDFPRTNNYLDLLATIPVATRKKYLEGTWKTEEEMSRDKIVDKSVDESSDKNQQRFKAGDKVKCIVEKYMTPERGEILTVKNYGDDGEFRVEENNFWYENEYFELVKSEPVKFKEGDKVKIRKDSQWYGYNTHNPAEVVGEVTRIHRDNGCMVAWPNGTNNGYSFSDLELAIEEKSDTIVKQTEAVGGNLAEPKKAKGFEVGKHYKCIDSLGSSDTKVGEYYLVKDVYEDMVSIAICNGGRREIYQKRFDPIAREDIKNPCCEVKLSEQDDRGFWQDQVDKISTPALPPWFEATFSLPAKETKWVEETTAGFKVTDFRNTNITVSKGRDSLESSAFLAYCNATSTFKINQQEEVNMNNRRVVNVQLVDDDKGLDVQYALVHDFGDRMTEDTNDVMIQELIMEGEVSDLIAVHNETRTSQTNLEIQDRTGQTVNLRPVKLKQLRWIIK